jgi:hypothetical protein
MSDANAAASDTEARGGGLASAGSTAVLSTRLEELGDYIDCLSEWDCTNPHEQAVEIRKFLTDTDYGMDHLREDGLEPAHRNGHDLHAQAIAAVRAYEEWTHYDETLWDAYGENAKATDHATRRRKLASAALKAIEACPVKLPADGAGHGTASTTDASKSPGSTS